MQKKNVLVLMGGTSTERDVSLATGKMICSSLQTEKYNILPIEIEADSEWHMLNELQPSEAGSEPALQMSQLLAEANQAGALTPWRLFSGDCPAPVDVVFIALHGGHGEDGTLQGVLDFFGVPYTGSGVLASALAMDKIRSRQLMAANGILVPSTLVADRETLNDPSSLNSFKEKVIKQLGLPCVVKPNDHGSSVGVTLVQKPEQLDEALAFSGQFSSLVLVEEYLKGTEITVGVFEDPDSGQSTALPIIEIVPKNEWFDYESKYDIGGAEEIIPARISAEHTIRAQEIALKTHKIIGCKGLSRTDMIIRGDAIYPLEVNTLPGMTRTSLFPQMARAVGIEFPDLLDKLIRKALQ